MITLKFEGEKKRVPPLLYVDMFYRVLGFLCVSELKDAV